MSLPLVYFGVTHKTAPVEVRERIQPDPDTQVELLAAFGALVGECAVLVTCGRFELYFRRRTGSTTPGMAEWAELLGTCESAIRPYTAVLSGHACAEHLFRVAAGLESQIIGESYILSQVRKALVLAQQTDAIGPTVSALFRSAVHCGRCVRAETGISRNAASFAEITVDRLADSLADFPKGRFAVVGSGDLACDVVQCLKRRGANRITILNRHIERAGNLAGRVGAEAAPLGRLWHVLGSVDAIVLCTSSHRPLIDAETLATLPPHRLEIVDLGLPRNVDSKIANIRGCHLVTLADIAPEVVDMGDDIRIAERIVVEQLRRFKDWQEARVKRKNTIAPAQRPSRQARESRSDGRDPYPQAGTSPRGYVAA